MSNTDEIAAVLQEAEAHLAEAKRWNTLPGRITDEKKHKSEDLVIHHAVAARKALDRLILQK